MTKKVHYTDKVVDVAVKDLIPYEKNARTHSDSQIEKIQKSILEFGFINPLIVDKDNNIIAGHGRLAAAKNLGLEYVPCIQASHLSDKQKKAYILADNQLPSLAGWNSDLLSTELKELFDDGFDIELTGFDMSFIDLGNDEVVDDDTAPKPPAVPVSALGDVWILGGHRLLCGDSTSITAVSALMDGKQADMVFTDPPYNTGMSEKTNKSSTRLNHMFNDSFTDAEWETFMADFCVSYDLATKEDCFIYVCLDWRRSHELVPHLKRSWKFSNLIVWDKEVHGLGSDYKYTHEFIHVCKKGNPPLAKNKEGDREYQDIWHIQRKMGKDEDHATKKPLELCERAIKHASDTGDIVLDLFGGSGSTLIACEKTGRKCYMAELDPKYVDVIINRWSKATGKEAVLESTDETFTAISKDRTKEVSDE